MLYKTFERGFCSNLDVLRQPVDHALPVLVEGPKPAVFEKGKVLVLEFLKDLE